MLKSILANSPTLLAFIAALQIALSKPQRQHVLNVVDGLIVGEGSKTLSALRRLIVNAPDPKAVADTLQPSLVPPFIGLKRFSGATSFFGLSLRSCNL
jgi:hypothetical protein